MKCSKIRIGACVRDVLVLKTILCSLELKKKGKLDDACTKYKTRQAKKQRK